MQRFKNILFVAGADDDPVGPIARAAELARRNRARLTVAAAVDRLPPWSALLTRGVTNADLQQAVLEQRRAELDRLVKGLGRDLRTEVRVLVGSPFIAVVQAVLRDGYDLVIKGAEGGGGGSPFGSTDLHLLRKCPVPVWIDRPSRAAGYRRVLAAVDPRPDEPQRENLDRLILELAGSMAAAYQAELHVLHAWSVPGEATLTGPFMNMPADEVAAMGRAVRRRRDAELRALLERHPPQPADYGVHLLKGLASRVIPAFVRRRRVDLVVMGTVGRTGLPGFFIGNTAESVLNQVNCSVMAVKPEGFVSPVSTEAA